MFQRATIAASLVLVAFAFVAGCDKKTSSSDQGSKATAESAQEGDHHHESAPHAEGEHHHDEQPHGEKTAKVDVPKGGKKFEPSIDVSRLPKGAWHCNMNGKVHYAAMEKGDGSCPVCNMDLKEK